MLMALALLAAAACRGLVLDADRVIALEIPPPPATVVVGDTVRLSARAFNAQGDVVPHAAIRWAIVDTGAVGFTLDSIGGLVRATAPGNGRVQARVENLRSDPIRITVIAGANPALKGGLGLERPVLKDPRETPFRAHRFVPSPGFSPGPRGATAKNPVSALVRMTS